jgi:hypothetical protein
MELAKSYPDDFNSTILKDLGSELHIYIDKVWADERFAKLNTNSKLARLMVDKKNVLLHIFFVILSTVHVIIYDIMTIYKLVLCGMSCIDPGASLSWLRPCLLDVVAKFS